MPKDRFNTNDAFNFLAERARLSATKPNILGYKPHAKQLKFHTSLAKTRLYIGGNRSGKTTSGICEDIWWLTGKHPYRRLKPPPIRGRIVSVDFLNGINKTIKPELARWCPLSELRNGSWEDAYDKQDKVLYFDNGSTLEFMSYDQDLDKFSGTARDFVHFDEEPPQDIRLECKTRLIDYGGSEWITMTPVEGMTWLYDVIFLPGKELTSKGLIEVIEVDMTENPYLTDSEVQEYISGLDADDKLARVKGRFVQLGGLIYKHFDPAIHVKDPFLVPKSWPIVASLDHGFNNPTAWLWHTVDPDGRIYTFYEHYESGLTIDKHAVKVHKINETLGRTPDFYIGDPSIRSVDPITGTSIQQEYIKYGIPIALANNDVAAGLVRVNRYLSLGVDGKPNLIITRNCQKLIWELGRYRWKTYANKKLMRSNNVFEVPNKKDDHACDSLRYFIMSRPDIGNLYISNEVHRPGNIVGGSTAVTSARLANPLHHEEASSLDDPKAWKRDSATTGNWSMEEYGGMEW